MEKFFFGIKDTSSFDKKEYYTMIPCYDKDDRDDIQLIKSYFKYNMNNIIYKNRTVFQFITYMLC